MGPVARRHRRMLEGTVTIDTQLSIKTGNRRKMRVSLIKSLTGGCGGGVHPLLNPGAERMQKNPLEYRLRARRLHTQF